MGLRACSECAREVSDAAYTCPHCGYPLKEGAQNLSARGVWGFEYKSKTEFFGIPVVHVAIGRNKKTRKLYVAKGIIAIGQFAIGLITFAQFGIGFLFGFGQFIAGYIAVAQFAAGIYFGLGQFATGITAIGQFAFGKYILAQIGFAEFSWTTKVKDPEAVEHFKQLLHAVKEFLNMPRT